jgi:hypothetical protein
VSTASVSCLYSRRYRYTAWVGKDIAVNYYNANIKLLEGKAQKKD